MMLDSFHRVNVSYSRMEITHVKIQAVNSGENLSTIHPPARNTAVKRYTRARGLKKAREKQKQIVYKRVES